eukprot:symbB.v1.2.034976.t1/scaffold4614.1/size37436/1
MAFALGERGIVIAKFHLEGAERLAAVDEMQQIYWMDSGPPVGSRFTNRAINSESLGEQQEGAAMMDISEGEKVGDSELYQMLARIACGSVADAVQKTVCSSQGADETSLMVIWGRVAELWDSAEAEGVSRRSTLVCGGREMLEDIPVTCAWLQEADAADVKDKFGLLVLRVVPKGSFQNDDRSLGDQIQLIGYQPSPASDTCCIPSSPLYHSIFPLKGPPTMASSNSEARFDKEFVSYLSFLECWPLWDSVEDSKALRSVKRVLQGQDMSVVVHRDAMRGCFVVQQAAGSSHDPGAQTVSLVQVTRGEGTGTVLASATLTEEQLEKWEKLRQQIKSADFTGEGSDMTPTQYSKTLRGITDSSHRSFELLSVASPVETVPGVFPSATPKRKPQSTDADAIRKTARPLVKSANHESHEWMHSERDHWACLKALVHYLLARVTSHPQPRDLYKKVIAGFSLHLTFQEVSLLTPATATPQNLRVAMEMLKKTSGKLGKLLRRSQESRIEIPSMVTFCQSIRHALDSLLRARGDLKASKYMLDPEEVLVKDKKLKVSIEMDEPLPVERRSDQAMQAATEKLNGFDLLEATNGDQGLFPVGKTFQNALTWLKKVEHEGTTVNMVKLHTIESIFLQHALGLDEKWCDIELEGMEGLIDEYLSLSKDFRSQCQWKVELQSREVLVVWIAYCLTWRATEIMYDLQEYEIGIGLCRRDLKRLLLSTKAEMDALKAVDRFLGQREHADGPLFNFQKQEATFLFASAFSAQYPEHQEVLRKEREAEQIRMRKHWEKVQQQQNEAARLRRELATLRSQLQAEKGELSLVEGIAERRSQASQEASRVSSQLTSLRRGDSRRARFEREESDLRHEVSQLQEDLENHESLDTLLRAVRELEANIRQRNHELELAEKPPHAVIQCLPSPKEEEKANTVLFFLYMPDLFGSLSRMTLLAQQLVLPWPWQCAGRWNVSQELHVEEFVTSWNSHYEMEKKYHDPPRACTPIHTAVTLQSRSECPEDRTIAGSHIDNLHFPEDGVWWPDKMDMEMACQSDGRSIGQGDFFNPFQPLSDKALTEYWTEQMPVSDMGLQWTMPIHDDKKLAQMRGNMSIASQDAKPEWLNKQDYHAFCSLRAYPLQQMRKLLIALEESSLPMTHRAVQHLLRQCMHQVGPLDDNQFHWKKDIESLMTDFEKVLLERVDEAVEKPRAHEAFPVLADLLNYFIQWAEDPMPLIKGCRKLSTAALKWARETLDQIQYHGPESQDAMHAK